VVGNNVGSGARPSLHYAEQDAAKVASVLTELCHFAPNDVAVLAGRNLADLRRELDEVKRSIFAFKEHHGSSRVLLAFYFSGHSDGASLELGSDRLPFSDLRESLHATGADVRLAVLDACHSGAAIGTKGGKRAEGFDLTALDVPELSGDVILSASRADEMALESREIEGSFFTHHLVSGLRGAADADGNAEVTLEELYRHTASKTSSSAAGVFGGQTPAYDYRLVGHGDLVLSDLRNTSDYVHMPGGFERVLFVSEPSGRIEVEAGTGLGLIIALPAGPYLLRGERGGKWYRTNIRVGPGAGPIRTLDFTPEVPAGGVASSHVETRELAEIARDFRPGNEFPPGLPKTNPYFCEATEGQWKGCRNGGCFVCDEMVRGFPHYFRNHPNCIVNTTCKGRFFTCSDNCPPPAAADSCDPDPNGWLGCVYGCAVCTLDIALYPHYFQNHPNCIPMPGRCKDKVEHCGAACPAPGPADR